MFVLSNLILAIATILDYGLEIYMWVIIISAVLSWVNPDPYNPIVRFLRAVTEPVLRPIRRLIGSRLGVIDVSPMIVLLAIVFLQRFLVRSLYDFAHRL